MEWGRLGDGFGGAQGEAALPLKEN